LRQPGFAGLWHPTIRIASHMIGLRVLRGMAPRGARSATVMGCCAWLDTRTRLYTRAASPTGPPATPSPPALAACGFVQTCTGHGAIRRSLCTHRSQATVLNRLRQGQGLRPARSPWARARSDLPHRLQTLRRRGRRAALQLTVAVIAWVLRQKVPRSHQRTIHMIAHQGSVSVSSSPGRSGRAR